MLQLQTTRNFIIIILSTNNNQQYIIFLTFTTFSDDFSLFVFSISFTFTFVSNNTFLFFAKTTFNSNSDAFTSIFVNELIDDLILQKIRLFNTTNVELKQQRTFNHYSKLCFAKNSFVNFLIDFAILFNCDSVVIKIVLILFVKIALVDFYESKTYKKTIMNAQHKMN